MKNLAFHRRRLLVGSAVAAMGSVLGCRQSSDPTAQPAAERSDVPLRIALVGRQSDADTIRRGWGALTEQQLDIQVIELNRSDSNSLADAVSAAVEASDVAIYPLTLIARLTSSAAIVALSDDDVDQIKEASGPLFPSLRAGVKYADGFYALPLGAPQPALLSRDRAPAVASWEEYQELVEKEWGGAASEPTAPGWAGTMFLWRTATSTNWLFDRDSLQPLIAEQRYVDSLRMMAQAHAQYQAKHQTPGQIWSAVQAGELQGGVGFPEGIVDGEIDLQVSGLPQTEDGSRVLLDPFSTMISLTSNCRQSAVAKRFIQWICGGVGSSSVRQQVAGMTEIRVSSANSAANSAAGRSDGRSPTGYNQWLAQRLNSPITIPTLQIIRGCEYYTALDAQVIRALDGEATPEQALAEVASSWQTITDSIGVEDQLRAWRRAQGMRT